MNQKVFVINQHGVPLMPTSPRKARLLLKQGKAKIEKRTPFSIKLLYGTRGYKQKVTLGIDAGYENIGFSAVTEKEELIGGELKLLSDVSERISEKSKYRTQRRNRLRHRAPRFNNRKREEGWLAPSIQHKYDSHIKIIEKIKSILPTTKIAIEVAPFDIQKIKNPDIKGSEYQQGEQLGYKNLTNYIRHRDSYKCQNPNCKNKSENKILQVHHIGYWRNSPDRSNRPGNLITLCEKCHTPANHKKGKFLFGWEPNVKSFKPETFMSTIYRKLLNHFDAEQTFGYQTSFYRSELKLEKSHHNDAFVIAEGKEQKRTTPLILEQIRRNKRSMSQFYDAKYIDSRTKGEKKREPVSGSVLFSGRRTRNKKLNGENFRKYRERKVSKGQRRIKKQRYKYNPNDYVIFEGKIYRVIGMQNLGKGVKIANYPDVKNKVVNIKEVKPARRRAGICQIST